MSYIKNYSFEDLTQQEMEDEMRWRQKLEEEERMAMEKLKKELIEELEDER